MLELLLSSSATTAESRALVHQACLAGAAVGAVQWLETLDRLRDEFGWDVGAALVALERYDLAVEDVTRAHAESAARHPHLDETGRADRLFLAAVVARGGLGLVAGEKRLRAAAAHVQRSSYLLDVRAPGACLPL